MAAGAESGWLTDAQIARLADNISLINMTGIAEGYMDFSSEAVKNLRYGKRHNVVAFNREIIRRWASRNPGNQRQALAKLLYKASDDNGYVDTDKVHEILEISKEEANLFPHSAHSVVQLDRAYGEACREGTKKVFNARMILAGYSEAGKTSLATKLLGGKINVDEKKSTEGIALHRIESTFNNKEKQKKGGK